MGRSVRLHRASRYAIARSCDASGQPCRSGLGYAILAHFLPSATTAVACLRDADCFSLFIRTFTERRGDSRTVVYLHSPQGLIDSFAELYLRRVGIGIAHFVGDVSPPATKDSKIEHFLANLIHASPKNLNLLALVEALLHFHGNRGREALKTAVIHV